MVGLSKMSKLIQTGTDIIDLPDLPGWRLPISPGKEPGTRGEPDEGTLPASGGNPAPDGNQPYRVAGLQGYRITGLQGYRVTGSQGYKVTNVTGLQGHWRTGFPP